MELDGGPYRVEARSSGGGRSAQLSHVLTIYGTTVFAGNSMDPGKLSIPFPTRGRFMCIRHSGCTFSHLILGHLDSHGRGSNLHSRVSSSHQALASELLHSRYWNQQPILPNARVNPVLITFYGTHRWCTIGTSRECCHALFPPQWVVVSRTRRKAFPHTHSSFTLNLTERDKETDIGENIGTIFQNTPLSCPSPLQSVCVPGIFMNISLMTTSSSCITNTRQRPRYLRRALPYNRLKRSLSWRIHTLGAHRNASQGGAFSDKRVLSN